MAFPIKTQAAAAMTIVVTRAFPQPSESTSNTLTRFFQSAAAESHEAMRREVDSFSLSVESKICDLTRPIAAEPVGHPCRAKSNVPALQTS